MDLMVQFQEEGIARRLYGSTKVLTCRVFTIRCAVRVLELFLSQSLQFFAWTHAPPLRSWGFFRKPLRFPLNSCIYKK